VAARERADTHLRPQAQGPRGPLPQRPQAHRRESRIGDLRARLGNQYVTTFTTTDGETASGDCSGQFYILLLDGKRDKWFLHKRHSARGGPHKERKDLEPIVRVKTVEFTDDFLKKLEEEKAKAEGETKGEAKPEAKAK